MAANPAKQATAKQATAKQATAKQATAKKTAAERADGKPAALPSSARPTTRPPIGRLVAPTAPRLLEASLPGGIHALVVRRPSLPLVELRLAVPLAADQIRKPAPVSILARSLFAGTESHDRVALAGAIEDLGASLDAHVGEDRVILSGAVLAEHVKELLALLVEVITSANYPPDEVKADRNRAADETLIALSQPDVVAAQALRRRLFGSHPYATPIPPPAALRRVDAAALHALHPVVLNPAGAYLVLVGDLQPNRAVRLAEEAMSTWTVPAGAPPADLQPVVAPRPGPLDLVPRPGSIQSNLRIGGGFARLGEPDWPAASLAEQISAGCSAPASSRTSVNATATVTRPAASSATAGPGPRLLLAADVATGVTGPALVEIFYELGRMATLGINEEELEMARRHSVGRFSFDTASLPGLATTLANLAIRGVDLGYLTAYPKAVIGATKQMVDEAAARHLAPSRLVTAVVGDPDVVTGPSRPWVKWPCVPDGAGPLPALRLPGTGRHRPWSAAGVPRRATSVLTMHLPVTPTVPRSSHRAARALTALVVPALATALMTSALVGAAATVAAAAAAPTTTSLLAAAKAAIARQGAVHLEVDSKSTTVADTEKVVADLGKKSGTEAISAGVGLQDAVTIVVTPAYGYVSGNSGGLSKIVGLSSAEVKKVGSKWITLKAGSSQYTSLATDIKVSSIESVLPPAKGTTLATETIPGLGVSTSSSGPRPPRARTPRCRALSRSR